MLSTFFGKEKRSNSWKVQTVAQSPRPGRASNSKYVQKRTNKDENELGFLSRVGSGTSLLDVDDEALEKLVGGATHLSLVRKSSKGKMVKIPSYERFDALVPVGNRRSSSDSSDDESEIFARMTNRRSSLSKPSPDFSKRASFSIGDNRTSDLLLRKNSKRAIVARKLSPTNKEQEEPGCTSSTLKKKSSLMFIDVDNYADESSGDVSQNRTPKRKLTRNVSRERMDIVIKSRRASISN